MLGCGAEARKPRAGGCPSWRGENCVLLASLEEGRRDPLKIMQDGPPSDRAAGQRARGGNQDTPAQLHLHWSRGAPQPAASTAGPQCPGGRCLLPPAGMLAVVTLSPAPPSGCPEQALHNNLQGVIGIAF